MSLLTMMQAVCPLIGLQTPTVVISSTDLNINQLTALANETGDELMRRWPWQELTKSFSFASTGALLQGTLAATFGTDYDHMIPQTFWDTSSRQPIDGPPTIQQWQQYQASNVVGPPYQFIVYGGNVYIGPSALASAHTLTGFYIAKNWCQSNASVGQTAFAADTDTTIIPQHLFELSLRWMYRKAKGLSYAEDMKTCERQIETYIAQNTPKRVLFMGGRNILYPANIPEGNWP